MLKKCPSVLPAGRKAEQPRHDPGHSLSWAHSAQQEAEGLRSLWSELERGGRVSTRPGLSLPEP